MKKINKIWLILLTFLIILFLLKLALYPPPASLDNVHSESGELNGVAVIRNGSKISVSLKMELINGDKIITDENSIAIIRLFDAKIILDKSSQMTIIDYNKNIYNHIGRVFVDVNHYFQVETKYVTAGVGGTKFQLSVEQEDIVTIDMIEGFIILKSNNGDWDDVEVSSYYSSQINGEAPPSQPKFTLERTYTIKIWLKKIEENLQKNRKQTIPTQTIETNSKAKIDIESQVKMVLRTAAKAQELYRLDRDIYADDINKLAHFEKNKSIILEVLHADRTSFIVAAYFENSGKYWTIDQHTNITVHKGSVSKDN